VEDQTEHPLVDSPSFNGATGVATQVKERLGQERAVLVNDPNAADTLDHEKPATAIVGGSNVGRIDQATSDLDELDGWVAREDASGLGGAPGRDIARSKVSGPAPWNRRDFLGVDWRQRGEHLHRGKGNDE
jgi:hypothetical protein